MTTAQASRGRLVVCPTPIGNLDDVTLRVIATLHAADLIACEDTRHSRALLERHAIVTPLLSFHEHNETARARELVEQIRAGAIVALVSDAGTPLVSDPGHQLVRACIQEGLALEALPGPSAVLTALVVSGLPAASWRFEGFLPRRAGVQFERLLGHNTETLVAFESPRRLARTLAALAALDPERPLAVCRELTKEHEEVRRATARELAAHYSSTGPGAGSLRGEIVLVIGAAPAAPARMSDALDALHELIAAGARTRPAAAVVAALTGARANELYREITREDPQPPSAVAKPARSQREPARSQCEPARSGSEPARSRRKPDRSGPGPRRSEQ